MLGGRSPESAQAVGNVLLPVLPNARVIRFPELGHMGPITHPEIVNAAIVRFLGEASPSLDVERARRVPPQFAADVRREVALRDVSLPEALAGISAASRAASP